MALGQMYLRAGRVEEGRALVAKGLEDELGSDRKAYSLIRVALSNRNHLIEAP